MVNGNLEMPPTRTPDSVWGTLVGLAILGCTILCILFSTAVLDWGGFWGVVVMFVVMGITTSSYTETVPGFFARIVLNHLTGKQRTIFQGLHPKLPWESVTRDVDLRVDLKDVLEETYASLDALMKTKYVYAMRPGLTGEAVILYASYESDALKQSIRALLGMLLSDHYGKNNGSDLLDKSKINQDVFQKEPGRSLVEEFEVTHGVSVSPRLEDSDFDETTQKARGTVAQAASFGQAVKEMVARGVPKEEAVKIAKMMQLPGVQEYIVSFDAKGVENLRDVSILPSGLGGGKKK